jgi:hypothetical protein
MNARVRELVLLALLSAFLSALALMYEQPLAAAVFAALTCAIGAIAVTLSTRRSDDGRLQLCLLPSQSGREMFPRLQGLGQRMTRCGH